MYMPLFKLSFGIYKRLLVGYTLFASSEIVHPFYPKLITFRNNHRSFREYLI